MAEGRGLAGRVAAVVLALFGSFPLVNWIPGGRTWPTYTAILGEWGLGLGILLGSGVALALIGKSYPGLWPGPWLTRNAERLLMFRAWPLLLGAAAFGLYAAIARGVFGARPLLIDEIVQVWQGRLLATGRLAAVPDAYPEFFSVAHIIDWGGAVYGQFPIGGPAFFALGTLVGAEWLVDPFLGAVAVVLFTLLLKRMNERPAVVVWGGALFAITPFWAFQAGSFMNHVPTVTCLLAGFLGLEAVSRDRGGWWAAALAGLGLAAAGAVRPVDGLAFAVPAFAWLAWRARNGRAERVAFAAAFVGALVPALVVAWANWRTTGAPTLFGYTVAWGTDHGLGFHAAPWGPRHTPAAGIELLNLYFLRLGSYLFEAPFPALLPAIAALVLVRRLSPFDRYLLAAGALLCAGYFAYWHDGFYLGPRFLLPLAPILVLWTARFPGLMLDRFGETMPVRVALYACVTALPLSLALGIPFRGKVYQHGMLTPRWDADAAADAAGVRGALVLVRESWGSQLLVRMWALGISRSRSEALYRRIDACRLEEGLMRTEAAGLRGAAAEAALLPLQADSARLVHAPFSADSSVMYLPGARYGPRCRARVAEDRAGFTVHTPLILAGRGRDNIYARDLHARDSLLVLEHPGRAIWLVTADTATGAVPRYGRVSVDSVWRAWRDGESP